MTTHYEKMPALRFFGKEDVRIEDVEIPVPGPGQVRLRNAYAGICGSDLHIYFAPEACNTDFSRPHPVTGATLPQILGHEFSGTVESVGPEVAGVEVGDEAAVWGVHSCGKCGACERGHAHACAQVTFHGVYAEGGGMARYAVVDASRLHKLPAGVDLRMGALVEPMAVAWHAVRRADVDPSSSVMVLGAGPIGLGVYFALKARGVSNIVVVDISEERLAIAQKVGVAQVVHAARTPVAEAADRFTDGRGFNHVIDAAGSPQALEGAISSLSFRGVLTIVALYGAPVEVKTNQLIRQEAEIRGSQAYAPEDFDDVIEAMAAGLYDFSGWVDVVPLDGFVAAAHRLRDGIGMKVLVQA